MWAQAYDNPVPGFETKTVGNLRLFEALPDTELDLEEFNKGEFGKVCPDFRVRKVDAVLEAGAGDVCALTWDPHGTDGQGGQRVLRHCATCGNIAAPPGKAA